MVNYFLYQRLTLYETPLRFYLVGSNCSGTKYNVLKVERTNEPKNLLLSEDTYEYSRRELDDLLSVVKNLVPKKLASKSSDTSNTLNAVECRGLLGFVRFLEGYYMIMVTKARRICKIGYHWIWKIEETSMIYVPSELPKSGFSAEEQRYLRTFQAVDLSTNFYFSYTYDLSRTLYHNITFSGPDQAQDQIGFEAKFLWNNYLREPMDEQRISKSWSLPVIHGFIAGCTLNVNSCTLSLVLIARRSCRFAGTRFLKRGANFDGSVANDVEIEQIVYDPSLLLFEKGRFTSFVQCRGSVPLIWSQDLSKVVGKPRIEIDLVDSFAVIPALHFRDLLAAHGSPVIVINLVKRREKRTHESVLNDEFKTAVSYLNQFLDPKDAILYLSFDMARCLKGNGNVLANLEEIGYNVVKLTGWFQTFAPLFRHDIRKSTHMFSSDSSLKDMVKQDVETNKSAQNGSYWAPNQITVRQTGIARVNCVDCLDRTNVAQLVIGKVALAHQLYALGTISEPVLSWDSEAFRTFESLFEEQGDTLALQYAGSQLVHSVRTYKKTAIFQERSRDVIQTLSRYYSNTFADYDKQNALNLFLGVYCPQKCKISLWELPNDFWLHNSQGSARIDDYCHWFELPDDYWIQRCVPYDLEQSRNLNLRTPDYDAYYKTHEMTSFDLLFNTTQSKTAANSSSNSTYINHVVCGGDQSNNVKIGGSGVWQLHDKPFWRRSKLIAGKTTTQNAEEDEDDEQDSSGEENGSCHSADIDVVYSTTWQERPLVSYNAANDSANQILSQQQLQQRHLPPTASAASQYRKAVNRRKSNTFSLTSSFSSSSTSFCAIPRKTTALSLLAPSASFVETLTTAKRVYGFELRDKFSKRDSMKYEHFAQMARRPSFVEESDRNDLSVMENIREKSITTVKKYDRSEIENKLLNPIIDDSMRNFNSTLTTTIDRFLRLQYHPNAATECFTEPASLYTSDSTFAVDPPEVVERALQKYAAAVHCAQYGPKPPNHADYQRYVDYLCCKHVAPA